MRRQAIACLLFLFKKNEKSYMDILLSKIHTEKHCDYCICESFISFWEK